MTLKCGIIGLPNVGKSTLFNALTSSSAAAAANYPFCTIEPNAATVLVPDERLNILANIAGSRKIIPTSIEFVDIAGLVKGASRGEGLGNKFLAHIREVDAIIHVMRCFEDEDVTHVHNKIDPLDDHEVIETELMLADLESVEKKIINLEKKRKSGDKTINEQLSMFEHFARTLEAGVPLRSLNNQYNMRDLSSISLLTAKPVLYICNVLEKEAHSGNYYSKIVEDFAKKQGVRSVVISSKIESEIALLESNEERAMFLSELGLKEQGLNKIVKEAYSLLDLKSFFTVGPKEAHAWTFKTGTLAPAAAGIIHSDFERGFIRAEIISYNDYIFCQGEVKAKELGKMRLEGKEYQMQDGDIVNFRFNV